MPPVAAAPLPRLAQEAAAAARLKHGKLQMAGRAEPAMTAHLFRACGRLPAVPAAERFPGPMASRAREFPGESSCSVFARGSPGNLLDSGQEVTLVPLTPITAVTRYWPVMDIVPPPSEDQVPRLQAFRAEHPDIEIASPAGSRTGVWPAYQGGTILVVTFGLRQLLDRLD